MDSVRKEVSCWAPQMARDLERVLRTRRLSVREMTHWMTPLMLPWIQQMIMWMVKASRMGMGLLNVRVPLA